MGDRAFYRFYARMSAAVMLKLLLAVGGYWLGDTLDQHWGTSPYAMFAGFCTGAGLGLWWVIRTVGRGDTP